MSKIKIKEERLRNLVINTIEKNKVPNEHASIVADVLIHADLRGVNSHGVLRTKHYIKRIKAGGLNIEPYFKIEKTGPTSIKFDGDNGLGHVISNKSMYQAIKLAKKEGIGVVTAFNSSHCGALSYYVKQATENNMIGIAMTQTNKIVTPFGGKNKFFGTNPIAFGVPSKKNDPIILDMSTSNVAFGKILQAREAGEEVPIDWGVDIQGNPTTDPYKIDSLLPISGPKGYGLGLMVDVLSGLLTGSNFGPHIKPMYDKLSDMRELGHFFMALNPDFFTDNDSFLLNVDKMINELHKTPSINGIDKVLVPG